MEISHNALLPLTNKFIDQLSKIALATLHTVKLTSWISCKDPTFSDLGQYSESG